MTSSWLLWCVPCCSGNINENIILLKKRGRKASQPNEKLRTDLCLSPVEEDEGIKKVPLAEVSHKSWRESSDITLSASLEDSTTTNSDAEMKSKNLGSTSTVNLPDGSSVKKFRLPWGGSACITPEDDILFTVPKTPPRSSTLPREATSAINKRDGKVRSRGSDHICDPTFGTVSLLVSTDDNKRRLHVYLEKILGLPHLGEFGVYDTAVKLDIHPTDKSFKISKVVKDSVTPEYDEHFVLPLADSEANQYLRVTVTDVARKGKYDAIGYGLYLLVKEKLSEEPQRVMLKLTHQSILTEGVPGKLLLSLSYQPSQDKISLVVMQAKDLRGFGHIKSATISDKLDTFCKIALMSSGEKVQSMKTKTAKTRNPFYNQHYQFCVRKGHIEHISFTITVMVKGMFKKSEAMGRVVLGPYLHGENSVATHWGKVIRTREVITQWHNLYL